MYLANGHGKGNLLHSSAPSAMDAWEWDGGLAPYSPKAAVPKEGRREEKSDSRSQLFPLELVREIKKTEAGPRTKSPELFQ